MLIAAIIISVISLVLSMTCIIWLLAKHFSTHKIQYVDPTDGMKNLFDSIGMGKPQGEEFRDMDDFKGLPVSPEDMPKKR